MRKEGSTISQSYQPDTQHRQPPENIQRHDLLLLPLRQPNPPQTGKRLSAELFLRSARPTD